MDPATEAKKLRQLCKLYRAELAAKVRPSGSLTSCTALPSHSCKLTASAQAEASLCPGI